VKPVKLPLFTIGKPNKNGDVFEMDSFPPIIPGKASGSIAISKINKDKVIDFFKNRAEIIIPEGAFEMEIVWPNDVRVAAAYILERLYGHGV